ncbi:MAG TPA: acylphosphatase [Candidatus Saccharimonadales bacterium]|nr:acylphosphatase [Candidatus Saccharimonadales bacterium]
MHQVKIKVTGKVQGVYFRDTARQVAENLEIQGFARNEPDGSVYIEAEGSDEAIDKFLAWCQEGSREAAVEGIEHTHHEPVGHRGFAIY